MLPSESPGVVGVSSPALRPQGALPWDAHTAAVAGERGCLGLGTSTSVPPLTLLWAQMEPREHRTAPKQLVECPRDTLWAPQPQPGSVILLGLIFLGREAVISHQVREGLHVGFRRKAMLPAKGPSLHLPSRAWRRSSDIGRSLKGSS